MGKGAGKNSHKNKQRRVEKDFLHRVVSYLRSTGFVFRCGWQLSKCNGAGKENGYWSALHRFLFVGYISCTGSIVYLNPAGAFYRAH